MAAFHESRMSILPILDPISDPRVIRGLEVVDGGVMKFPAKLFSTDAGMVLMSSSVRPQFSQITCLMS